MTRSIRARKEIAPGTRFGRLTVIRLLPPKAPDYRTYYACQCDCGRETSVRGCSLRGARTMSCAKTGCYRAEVSAAKRSKHGLSRHPLYSLWSEMLRRCENPKAHNYRLYGGRGITVCDRWHIFAHFLEDMPSRPSKRHSIDRLNNDLGYQPGNVAWNTPAGQAKNTRTAIRVTLFGEKHSLNSARKVFGLASARPISRYISAHGCTAQDAVDYFAAEFLAKQKEAA